MKSQKNVYVVHFLPTFDSFTLYLVKVGVTRQRDDRANSENSFFELLKQDLQRIKNCNWHCFVSIKHKFIKLCSTWLLCLLDLIQKALTRSFLFNIYKQKKRTPFVCFLFNSFLLTPCFFCPCESHFWSQTNDTFKRLPKVGVKNKIVKWYSLAYHA